MPLSPTDIPLASIPLLGPALPEILLAGLALILLVIGAVRGNRSTPLVMSLAVAGLAGISVMLLGRFHSDAAQTFSGMFMADSYATLFKLIIVGGAITALGLAIPYWRLNQSTAKPEYAVLIFLSVVGMFCMVSSNDLLSTYIGLELQSFALYILASFQRENRFASEAGLKYFFLGALSSGILLYGMSLMYGYAGTTHYLALSQSLTGVQTLHPGLIIGLVMVVSGMAFKIAAVPFHMWAPDVYQGAPTPVTAFFAMAPKAAAFGMLIRLLFGPLAGLVEQWQQIVIAMSVLSIVIGSFAGLRQMNIKRLMAYSSIGHVGFVLLGLAAGTVAGMHMAIIYIILYVVMSAGSFAVILSLYDEGVWHEDINSLSGLAKTRPVLAVSFAAILFSMAGIPIMAGFLAKLYVLKAAIEANLITVSVIAVVASVVSAFYYLRLIKIMYFDEPVRQWNATTSKIYPAVAVISAILLVVLTFELQMVQDWVESVVITLS